MPVYNHARFLPQALASLVAQTRLPDELIAVDDGSSDESAATDRKLGAQRAVRGDAGPASATPARMSL